MGSHCCDVNSEARVALLPHKVQREISDLTVFKAISSDLKVPTSEIPGNSDCFEGTIRKQRRSYFSTAKQGTAQNNLYVTDLLRPSPVLSTEHVIYNRYYGYMRLGLNDFRKRLHCDFSGRYCDFDFLHDFLQIKLQCNIHNVQ